MPERAGFARLRAAWITAWALLFGLVAWPAAAVPGLLGNYYNNTTLSGTPSLVRVDEPVNFAWGSGSPGGSVNNDYFSVRWTGTVTVPSTGSYVFQTVTDDGVRVYVNGVLVINNWTVHVQSTDTSAGVSLTAGTSYSIVVEYFENWGDAVMRLNWKKPGDAAFSTIPALSGGAGLSTTVSPLAAYLFEEISYNGTSGEANDSGSFGYDGTGGGLTFGTYYTQKVSPAFGSASNGTCRYPTFLRSSKQYIALPNTFPSLLSLGSFTVTAWIRTTDRTQAGQRIFIQDEFGYGGTTNGYIFSLGDRGAGKLNFLTRATNAVTDETTTGAVIADNTWYFTVFGVDAPAKRKFVMVYSSSGTLLSSVSTTYTTSSIGTATGTTSIGGETNSAVSEATSSYGFGGNIDDVRVYPGAMSATEVDAARQLVHGCKGLVASYAFEESAWSGTAGELKDAAGWAGGPYSGQAVGSTKPSPASASPARSGTTGTCAYATMPGPNGSGGYFSIGGLPVSTTAGDQTTVAFWMYWNGTDDTTPVSFANYNLWLRSGYIGFNTGGTDVYGTASTGLSGGWHHVVAVFTNGTMTGNQLYIDGTARSLFQLFSGATTASAYATATAYVGTWGGGLGTSALIGRVDELRVLNYGVTPAEATALYTETHPCSSLHHLEIRHASGGGLTCTPSTLTIAACQDAACTTAYTGGVTGTLTATGSPTVQWPAGASFSIGSGSSSTTEDIQLTTPGSVLLATSGLSVTASNATTCNFGSPSCTFAAADSGFVFDVPNHASDTPQTVNVSAVRKSDSAAVCVPAFASVSKNVTFSCAYGNPTTGTLPVRVGGAALNAANNAAGSCDAGGRAVSLAFDAGGVASTTFQYADAGRMTVNAGYTGSGSDAGLAMTGTDSFIAAPAAFTIGSVTAAPIKAGSAFSATVTAKNASGATTPNFGRETSAEGATLSFTKRQPTGSAAVSGTFSGSLGAFTSGTATATNLAWTEVGNGDLTATLSSGSYLGSGLTATGTTGSAGAVGRFIPHHFDVTATAGCGSFSYAGQPFGVTVTARNAANAVTVNYDGSANTTPNFAKAVTLGEPVALGVGTLSGSAVAASAFAAGVAGGAPTYTFTAKLTGPRSLALRATDTDAVSSSGYAEPTMALRSGRLRLVNGFGADTQALKLVVAADYWSGNAWVPNSADNCTALVAGAVAKSNQRDRNGNATSAWSTTASAISLTAGQGLLTLTAPGAGNTGTLDLALNLGGTAADQSCLATHPASTAGGVPWLRSQQGSCAATFDRDPSARASFGIFSPETRKTVHVRELY